MAKKESTFMSMLATLFVVTLVAAGLLGSVYALTKEPIRLAELAKKNEAIQVVVPGFDNEPSTEVERLFMDGDSLFLYTARLGEEVLGSTPLDVDSWAHLEPVYETFPGWSESSRGATAMEQLPANARDYLKNVERLCEAPIHIVSTGPDRSENIIQHYPFSS